MAIRLLGKLTLYYLIIAVIVFVAVKKLYVRDSLGEATAIPGETDETRSAATTDA